MLINLGHGKAAVANNCNPCIIFVLYTIGRFNTSVEKRKRPTDLFGNRARQRVQITAMNNVQEKLLELKNRGWTMRAISDELSVSHMTVFRWQKGMRNARNARSVLYLLESLIGRKRIPKRKRRGPTHSLKNLATEFRKSGSMDNVGWQLVTECHR